MWQTNGNFFRILFIPNSSRRQLCIFTLFLFYCVQFFLPSFIPKPKKIQYFTRRKHIRSLLSISPNCLYLFCKKLRHRNQTCVNPRLPADSSCQQTKANHVLLSLKELNLFLLPDRLHKAKSSPKKQTIRLTSQKALALYHYLLCSYQIRFFVSETGPYTAALSHEKPPVDRCEVCTELSHCSASANAYIFGWTSAASLAKYWCRSSEAMLRMLNPRKQMGWREDSCWLHVDAGLGLQSLS